MPKDFRIRRKGHKNRKRKSLRPSDGRSWPQTG
jgi:hypothetical protein